ncbi:rCG26547 [Rattus norvegicus]|uniref:RCG26547 n=1 Tax=Rattus norvegicus TaxID=10116 RepID=A6HM75_RAT|nr:rCG26547 [Rattus norvegicus]
MRIRIVCVLTVIYRGETLGSLDTGHCISGQWTLKRITVRCYPGCIVFVVCFGFGFGFFSLFS